MKIFWLVTARYGSKRLPHKNIKLLGGIPLLAWRILAAKKIGGTIWLSTDSEEYAAIGKKFGAEVPFIRPKELAGDGPCHYEAISHAVDVALSMKLSFDAICLLQPTSPFCSVASLQKGIDRLAKGPEAKAVVAVKEPSEPSVFIVPESAYLNELTNRYKNLTDNRRQALTREMTPCGAFYFANWDFFVEHRTFWTDTTAPLLLENPDCIDIDDDWDFSFAEFCLATGKVCLNDFM